MNDKEVIKIKISSSFMVRARCKHCGTGPSWYYYIREPLLVKDHKIYKRASEMVRSWLRRMTEDWYLESEPRWFTDLRDFSVGMPDIGYRPRSHRIRNTIVRELTEIVSCDCGKTAWAFNDKTSKNRPEIANRKGRYHFPKKFTY